MTDEKCMRCGNRVGWIGIGANLVMVILKVFVGFSAGSRACLADALHSSTNIITAFAIFVSRKITRRPVDDQHPYGYGKAEFIAAGTVSVLIIALTMLLVVTSIKHIIFNPVPPPDMTALFVALISIITNEMLFRYFRCVGTQLRSQTIIANAWANRADCFSSVAVVVGVLGARLGFHHLDPVAAVFVAGIIVKMSIGCIRDSIAGLMDRSVPAETLKALRKSVTNVAAVRCVKAVRARSLGDKIWVELDVQISGGHKVHECEIIRRQIDDVVMENVRAVGNIMVDFEPAEES